MIGWAVTVYRQKDGGSAPAEFGAATGTELASWHACSDGLDWLEELWKQKKVIALGGGGYPYQQTVKVADIKKQLVEGPPDGFRVGKNLEELEACRPDEWLLIEVWDRS